MAKGDEVRIEYMPLSQIQGWKRNPKLHEIPAIQQSLRRFGFVQPIAMDDSTQRLVAGHGRLEALIKMRDAGDPAPARIRVRKKEWFVPVIRGVAFANETEAEAFLIADNRLSEIGGWDEEGLNAMLRDQEKFAEDASAVLAMGFSTNELDRIIAGAVVDQDSGGSDPRIELPSTAIKSGDMFLLGDHRLICGDATDPDVVARVVGEASPGLMATDPPYGVEYDPEWRDGVGLANADRALGKVENDGRVDWSAAFKLFTGDVAYVWHAGLFAAEVKASLANSGFQVRSQIIWAKKVAAISRGHYHWKHEPCWYAVRNGKTASWTGARDQTTLWEMDSAIGFVTSGAPEDEATGHSTQKPVEAWKRPILNHTERGDWIFEPFSGSGTAFVAAEQLGRRCAGVELNPVYCQVIINRWEKLTGKKAQRAS